MKKIPSLFVRDWNGDRSLVTREVNEGCDWVVNGRHTVISTRKWDGTCVKIDSDGYWKRYDAKHGKIPPVGFVPAMDPDPITGHRTGWLLVDPEKPEDKWFMAALTDADVDFSEVAHIYRHGTYELCGPKVGGNPEKLLYHVLIPHGLAIEYPPELSFDGIKQYLWGRDIEGLVFYRENGENEPLMCKIKKSDFGLKRG